MAIKQKVTIMDIWEEYRTLSENETDLSEVAKGRIAAYDQVIADCAELYVMAEYRKASKRKQRDYLQRAISCYQSAWPLDDPFSVAAHTAMQAAAKKFEQVAL